MNDDPSKLIDSFVNEFEFLSNFHPTIVRLDSVLYPTVEHAYQAAKTLNLRERYLIQLAESPGRAKRFGRTVTKRSDWPSIKFSTMSILLEQKFEIPELKGLLLATGTAELVEGNWWGDTYWGVCEGVGENHLGKLLMEVREFHKVMSA